MKELSQLKHWYRGAQVLLNGDVCTILDAKAGILVNSESESINTRGERVWFNGRGYIPYADAEKAGLIPKNVISLKEEPMGDSEELYNAVYKVCVEIKQRKSEGLTELVIDRMMNGVADKLKAMGYKVDGDFVSWRE